MKRRTFAAVIALFFVLTVVGAFGAIQIGGSGGTLTEIWVSDTARDATANHHAPTAARIGNETVVIAPVNAPQKEGDCALVAFSTDLNERWRATAPPDACNIHSFGDPTVADLDEDGNREVFVATTEEITYAYDLRTGSEEFNRELAGWGYAAPVVADFTPSDGRELIVADLSGGVAVFDSTGAPLWRKNLSSTVAPIFVDDFDADGTDELAIGEGKNVTLVDPEGEIDRRTAVTGTVTWMTTGQADGDAAIEIVAATIGGRVVAVDGETGTVEWQQDFDAMAAVYAFGDGDDDGRAEVYAVAQDGKIRAIDASDGTVEWTTTLTTEAVKMTPPPALGDLDGDGEFELAAVSQDGVVSVIDPKSGEIVDSYERDVPIWMRPTLVDLDGDEALEILVVYGDGRVVALSFESE